MVIFWYEHLDLHFNLIEKYDRETYQSCINNLILEEPTIEPRVSPYMRSTIWQHNLTSVSLDRIEIFNKDNKRLTRRSSI